MGGLIDPKAQLDAPVQRTGLLASNPRWQDQLAKPDWQNMLTRLSPQEEAAFQQWAKQNNIPITNDYDMRGFFEALKSGDPRAITAINPNDNMLHFPDVWKTPVHESFSGESIFADPSKGPPMWNPQDQLVAPNGQVLFDEKVNAQLSNKRK